MARIGLLKMLDRMFGPLACRILLRCAAGELTEPLRRFLVIRPGGIGDAVLLVPVIRSLKKKYPDCRIDILAEKRNSQVFDLCPAVDAVYHYDQRSDLFGVLGRRYDVVIDSEQWHRLSAVLARLVRSKMKIGYGTNERWRMFTHPVEYRQNQHETHNFFRLLEPLGVKSSCLSRDAFLVVPVAEKEQAEGLLADVAARPFVVLFPGASIAERRWPPENFRELATRLMDRGIPSVVVGSDEDWMAGARICRGLAQALNLAGKTSLAGTAAVMQRAKVLVSGDSGVLHLAVGSGVPTASLFGPGIAAKWAPRGDNHIVLNHHLDCSPCTRFGYTPSCSHGARCIQDITVEEVFTAVMTLLESTKDQKAN